MLAARGRHDPVLSAPSRWWKRCRANLVRHRASAAIAISDLQFRGNASSQIEWQSASCIHDSVRHSANSLSSSRFLIWFVSARLATCWCAIGLLRHCCAYASASFGGDFLHCPPFLKVGIRYFRLAGAILACRFFVIARRRDSLTRTGNSLPRCCFL